MERRIQSGDEHRTPKIDMMRFPPTILATCVVPWDADGNFMEELFRHQVRHLLNEGVKNLYIFGTAGEGYAVSERQFDQVVRVFQAAMQVGGGEPMVGVISLSLTTVIERISRCREMGIRLFQISLPSWGPLNETELFEFFRQTCGRFPDCRFLHYNLPRTKRLVTPGEYARLAREHSNLVATKNSTDSLDRIEGLLSLAPELCHFFDEMAYAPARQMGECGLLASLSTTNWQTARAYFDAGRKCDTGTLLPMLHELTAMARDLSEVVGGTAHMDGAFDKMLWRLHDNRFPLRLLPPYSGVSEACFERFQRLLEEKYPRWTPAVAGELAAK
jgi:dihydrodipicolinate synthase/N-acetylneuraminate lyase